MNVVLLTFSSAKKPGKIIMCILKINIVLNIGNNKKYFFENQMSLKHLNEGSCDPEDWSNGC